jgi:hypothetical protein
LRYQSSGQCLGTFSRSRHKTSQQFAELACQEELFVTDPLDVKENDEHALDFAFHLSHIFRSRRVWTFSVQHMLSSLNACLIIARVSVALFPRFSQNLMLFLCRIHRKIASGQIHDSKEKDVKISTSTQPREMLYTDSQDMLVLPLPLHHAFTTAVQMAAPVLEITMAWYVVFEE